MDFTEAKAFLAGCIREELRDHAFGDAEVYWYKDGVEVASGYYGEHACAGIHEKVPGELDKSLWSAASKEEARAVRYLGTAGKIERNDETGPDEYREGQVMKGLSLGDVLEELTGNR